MFSQQFLNKLKLSKIPHYKLAQAVGIHPSLLSKWINGAQKVPYGDQRALKLGKLVGFTLERIFLKGGNPK